MRVALSLVIVAGCACSALAWDGKPAATPTIQPATPAPAELAALKPIPTPFMPVLKRTALEGGVIIQDMKLGDGYEVKPGGEGGAVVAHYDGTRFSSFINGQPAGYPFSSAMPAWRKGIPGMRVGGIRMITIPEVTVMPYREAMAHAEKASRPQTPEASDAVFLIQLVDALRVEDLRLGVGELTASSNCVAITTYTITDKDGKVIEKHDATDPYIWLPGEYLAMGMSLEGMKVGGKRRVMVPAAFNQPNNRFPSDRPANVPVTIEVELLNLRNLPPAAMKSDEGC